VFEGTGSNLRVTQDFLGHASPEMTSRYVHVTREDLRRASQAARLAA
jgi:site-specific recombinase XerD